MFLAIQAKTRQITLGQTVAEVEALRSYGTNQHSDIGGDAVTSSSKQRGTSSRYHIARLKRDHPATAQALARGEYPSGRAPSPGCFPARRTRREEGERFCQGCVAPVGLGLDRFARPTRLTSPGPKAGALATRSRAHWPRRGHLPLRARARTSHWLRSSHPYASTAASLAAPRSSDAALEAENVASLLDLRTAKRDFCTVWSGY